MGESEGISAPTLLWPPECGLNVPGLVWSQPLKKEGITSVRSRLKFGLTESGRVLERAIPNDEGDWAWREADRARADAPPTIWREWGLGRTWVMMVREGSIDSCTCAGAEWIDAPDETGETGTSAWNSCAPAGRERSAQDE